MTTEPAPVTRRQLLSTYFRSPEYLSALPLHTPPIALDYFSTSPFYDAQSNNEVLRMQRVATAGLGAIGRTGEEEEELKGFQGVEFVVVGSSRGTVAKDGNETSSSSSSLMNLKSNPSSSSSQVDKSTPLEPPPLYLVQRRHRESASTTRAQETYYILNGNVHQSPDLASVLQGRLCTALHALREGLDLARRDSWRSVKLPEEEGEEEEENQDDEGKAKKKRKADQIVLDDEEQDDAGVAAGAEARDDNDDGPPPPTRRKNKQSLTMIGHSPSTSTSTSTSTLGQAAIQAARAGLVDVDDDDGADS